MDVDNNVGLLWRFEDLVTKVEIKPRADYEDVGHNRGFLNYLPYVSIIDQSVGLDDFFIPAIVMADYQSRVPPIVGAPRIIQNSRLDVFPASYQ